MAMSAETTVNQTEPIISIGAVAEKLGVSVSTIRKYEADGLIIPHRTESGHRLFSLEDIDRLRAIQHMIQEGGLNTEGIRRLQAMLPCWELLPCKLKKWNECPAFKNGEKPCWMIKGLNCVEQGNECRQCKVYRFGSLNIEGIKQVVYRENCSKEIKDSIERFVNPKKE
jgi:MerR family transcriptional regulator/heat shock protein HspR